MRPTGGASDEYITVSTFDITQYQCGLRAGDRLRLKRDLPILNEEGNPTDALHKAGEIWTVLSGSSRDPEALWLRQADGNLHAWDDNTSIFDQFEAEEK